jgi:hypothetical protein
MMARTHAGPSHNSTPQSVLDAPERTVVRACPARKCKRGEGHDDGVHGVQHEPRAPRPPRAYRLGARYLVNPSPKARHGVDDQPRRSVALRSLRRHHAAARAALDSNST